MGRVSFTLRKTRSQHGTKPLNPLRAIQPLAESKSNPNVILASSANLQNFRLATEAMHEGLVMYDEDLKLVFCNQAFSEIYDLSAEVLSPGLTMGKIWDLRRAAGSFVGNDPDDYAAHCEAEFGQTEESVVALNNGKSIHVRRRYLPGHGWVATHCDCTERVGLDQRIRHLAKHDPMTGLGNRMKLNEWLVHAVDNGKPSTQLAMLTVDLDRFKSVNDIHGHTVGDQLLCDFASRMKECASVFDVSNVLSVRLGGDEFAILLNNENAEAEALQLAVQLIASATKPYYFDGKLIFSSMSVGVACSRAEEGECADLMKKSGIALKQAKSDGRGRVSVFNESLDARVQVRQNLQAELRLAIVREQFEVHYQPVVDMASNRVTSFEALIRWRHPKRGLVPPFDFIPLAEETGLIVALGQWVLQRVCRDLSKLPGEIGIAINMSSVQFHGDGPKRHIEEALKSSGVSPSRLTIEITESLLFGDTKSARQKLTSLKGLGVQLALDDFGTGFSSLSYLSEFPFDKIKIDRSFVKELPSNRKALRILGCVAALGGGLGLRTTAEGVETVEQLEIVRAQGCSEAQGFFFSEPLPLHDAIECLAACEERARGV